MTSTNSADYRLPLSRPFIGQAEEANVLDALRSGWISPQGPYVEAFEARFAELCGARHALAVTSGTAALHLALAGLRLEPHDEVIVPALTYVATAHVVRYLGAEPVFVDVDPESWCIDATAVEAACTPRTRGVIAVDLYGYPVDLAALRGVTADRGLWLLEDAAEAIGAERDGLQIGNAADVTAFSFYGNKVVSCGQGGALTLNDEGLYVRLKMLRNQARDHMHPYRSSEVGYNYGLSNVSCAILCAQLDRLNDMLDRRRELWNHYGAAFNQRAGVGRQVAPSDGACAPWLAAITVGDGGSSAVRDELANCLTTAGVETRPFFYPLHLMPPYRACTRVGELRESVRLSNSGINLPIFVGMSADDVDSIVDEVQRQLDGRP